MSYDPAYYAPHVNALNYANTVTATFESNFPGMFGFAESEEKAHALLACALAHQSRSTLNRIATAMNYVGGSALSLLSSVVGSPALNVPGLSAQVAQQIADEFVAVAFPIAESLNAKLENVAGQPGTFFSAPDTWSGDWEIAEMSGAFNQFYVQVQTIANLEASAVSADSSANIVYVAVANELLRRLDQVKVALDYLNTKDGFLGDAFTRSTMLNTLTDGPFGGFVNMYDIDRDAAIEFATAFVNIMLNVVEEQVGVLEQSRATYAQAVASAGAAAQAEALRLAEEEALNARNVEIVQNGAMLLNESLLTTFGPLATFTPPDRPTEAFHRFSTEFDYTNSDYLITVRIPAYEWTWPADRGPLPTDIVGGEPWAQFEARFLKTWATMLGDYPVRFSVAPTTY